MVLLTYESLASNTVSRILAEEFTDSVVAIYSASARTSHRE